MNFRVSRIVHRRSGVATREPSSLVDCPEHNVLSANTLMLRNRRRLTAVMQHAIAFALTLGQIERSVEVIALQWLKPR